MKVIVNTMNISGLRNEEMWEHLKSKGMDMNKPIFGCPCKASNTIYGFCYEGTKQEKGNET